MKKTVAVMLLTLAVGLLGVFGLLGAGCEVGTNTNTHPPLPSGEFELTSTAFADGAAIPLENASTVAGGENISPPLAWAHEPEGTTHYVLTMVDTTDPGFPLSHWVVVNIPASTSSLAANAGFSNDYLPAGAFHVLNAAHGLPSYEGPFPPADETHTYTFTLYALSESVQGIVENSTLEQVQDAIAPITLDTATYTGTYTGAPD